MKIEENTVILRKLIAGEGKALRLKRIDYDEEGKEIPRELHKEIYLAVTDTEDNYEEVDEKSEKTEEIEA